MINVWHCHQPYIMALTGSLVIYFQEHGSVRTRKYIDMITSLDSIVAMFVWCALNTGMVQINYHINIVIVHVLLICGAGKYCELHTTKPFNPFTARCIV